MCHVLLRGMWIPFLLGLIVCGSICLHLQCSLVLTSLCCFTFGDLSEDESGAEAQQAKVLVIVSKPDGLNLTSGTHMRKGRTDSLMLSSDLHTYLRPRK